MLFGVAISYLGLNATDDKEDSEIDFHALDNVNTPLEFS